MSIGEKIINLITTHYSAHNFSRIWGPIAVLTLLLHIVERVVPAERNQSYAAMAANGRIVFIYAIFTPVTSYFAGYLVATATNLFAQPLFVVDLNKLMGGVSEPVRVALLIPSALVPLFVYDFFYYWFHRLQHTNTWLWEQHKLHHGDQALNVTTAYRLNWLEEFLKILLMATPWALLLGLNPVESGIASSLTSTISTIQGIFLHSNIRLRFGFLSTALAGPQFHRIHHSIERHHQNKNYTIYFPIWDVLFGTYYHPSREEFPRTGVVGEPSDPTTREILIGPFISWAHRIQCWKNGTPVSAGERTPVDASVPAPDHPLGWSAR